MTDSFSILNPLLHNFKTANLKILFDNSRNIETTDYNTLNKYAIDKFNKYIAANAKDYNF